MGSGLVMAAYEIAQQKRIGNAATRLLAWIAVSVDDRKEPAVYYGGAEHRRKALREGTSDRAIRLLMSELKDAGVLEEILPAQPGRNASYRLLFSTKERRKNNFPHLGEMAEVNVRDGGSPASGKAEEQLPPDKERSQIEREEQSSPYCSNHPNGTDKPCWACKTARANYRPAKKKFVAHAEDMCADGRHKWLSDGTCNFCTQKRTPTNQEWMYR